MLFPVKLQVLVSADGHREPLGLSRTIELPFAPFPGLTLFGVMDDKDEPVVVDSVGYDVSDKTFVCDLESDEFVEEEEESGLVLTMAQKLDEYGDDWQVHEPGDVEADEQEIEG